MDRDGGGPRDGPRADHGPITRRTGTDRGRAVIETAGATPRQGQGQGGRFEGGTYYACAYMGATTYRSAGTAPETDGQGGTGRPGWNFDVFPQARI
jgi:hypothetical protein